jgi:hypothetical protein
VRDRNQHHKTARSVKATLLLFAGSALGVPIFVGWATRSFLLAAVAFCVWTSVFSIVFAIIVSSRVATVPGSPSTPTPYSSAASPPVVVRQPAGGATTVDAWLAYRDEEGMRPQPGSHLANGWLLPLRVTLRSEPSVEVASAAGKRVIVAASTAFGFALLGGLLAFSAYGSSSATATVIGLLALEIAAYDLVVLLFTRHSVRGGMPRPTLDRPSSLIGVFIPVALIGVLALSGALGALNHWDSQLVLGFGLLLASIGANVWWLVESAQRWNLTYEVVDL